MTEREYGDLKNKIVTAENNYLIKSMAISLCICFGAIGFVAPFLKGPFEFGFAVILWIASLVVISIANPLSKKEEGLDELFKSKTSYEEAEKKLGLKYEPPKN